MKAIVYTKYGSPDVLELKEVEKPTPKDNQVQIKVHAAAANPLDWHTMRGAPFLVRLGGCGARTGWWGQLAVMPYSRILR